MEGGLDLIEIKNVIERKIFLIAACTLTIASLGLLKVITSPPRYVASFELLSESVNIQTKLTSDDTESRKTREEIASVELDEVQLKILKSPRLISRAIESLRDKYPELNYQELTRGLSIDIITNSNNDQNILEVVYQNSDPEKVSDVIDTLTQTYIDYSVEKRQSGVKRGIAFLDQQIPKVSKQVAAIDKQISDLRSKYNFVNPDVSIQQTYQRIDSLTKEREQIDVKLQELQLKSNNLQRELGTQPAKSSTAIELGTPRYLRLLNQLQETEVAIGRNSAVFSGNSLHIQTLQDEKQQIMALLIEAGEEIRQKLENQISSLQSRKNTINSDIAELQLQLKQWSVIAADFNNLKQKSNRANNKLSDFTLRKDSLEIDAAQQDAPWLLLTPAGEPANNNLSAMNYLILSSTLGLIVGVATALMLDKYQDIVYTTAKVEEVTDLPILGSIPYYPKLKQLSLEGAIAPSQELKGLAPNGSQLAKQSASLSKFFMPSIEAFNSFAANLGLLNFSANPEIINSDLVFKSLVITSATPGEGKSTVALNLAKASASVGKRVLLVDTDMRDNPESLSKSLGLETAIGLRNLLNRDVASLGSNYIQKLSIEENLYILTSGFIELEHKSHHIDSSRLLASTKMYSIMEELEHLFDLVIYDLSAIIGFADVNLLAAKTDGIVLVTGLGKIQTATLTEALNQLSLCQAPVLGIAVNKLVNKS